MTTKMVIAAVLMAVALTGILSSTTTMAAYGTQGPPGPQGPLGIDADQLKDKIIQVVIDRYIKTILAAM